MGRIDCSRSRSTTGKARWHPERTRRALRRQTRTHLEMRRKNRLLAAQTPRRTRGRFAHCGQSLGRRRQRAPRRIGQRIHPSIGRPAIPSRPPRSSPPCRPTGSPTQADPTPSSPHTCSGNSPNATAQHPCAHAPALHAPGRASTPPETRTGREAARESAREAHRRRFARVAPDRAHRLPENKNARRETRWPRVPPRASIRSRPCAVPGVPRREPARPATFRPTAPPRASRRRAAESPRHFRVRDHSALRPDARGSDWGTPARPAAPMQYALAPHVAHARGRQRVLAIVRRDQLGRRMQVDENGGARSGPKPNARRSMK